MPQLRGPNAKRGTKLSEMHYSNQVTKVEPKSMRELSVILFVYLNSQLNQKLLKSGE